MSDDKLSQVLEARAARKAKAAEARNAQFALDLEAIDQLEIEHGDGNIAFLEVPFTDGLPVLVACRTPKPAEMKRYRSRLDVKPGKKPDTVAAAEELASVVRVYPDPEVYAELCAARPGVHVQLGVKSLELATASEAEEGKG